MNSSIHNFFDQLEQILVFIIHISFSTKICLKILENSEFVVSDLVVGCGGAQRINSFTYVGKSAALMKEWGGAMAE